MELLRKAGLLECRALPHSHIFPAPQFDKMSPSPPNAARDLTAERLLAAGRNFDGLVCEGHASGPGIRLWVENL